MTEIYTTELHRPTEIDALAHASTQQFAAELLADPTIFALALALSDGVKIQEIAEKEGVNKNVIYSRIQHRLVPAAIAAFGEDEVLGRSRTGGLVRI